MTDQTETATTQAQRRDRYKAAIRETDGWVLDDGQHMIDAVMAVADAEQAEARERYMAGLRRADEINNRLMEEVQRYAEGTEHPVLWSVYNAMHKRALTGEARVAELEQQTAAAPAVDRAAVLRKAADIAESLRQFEPATGARKSAQVSENVGIVRVADELRRLADETPDTEAQPEQCAHCGKNILRVTGTLATWWVHDPGGHTICFPQQAASSTRATPKAAAERVKHSGPDAKFCVLCLSGEHERVDTQPAAGARQDGADRG